MGLVRLREWVQGGLAGPRRRQLGGRGLPLRNRAPPGATGAGEGGGVVGVWWARAMPKGGCAGLRLATRLEECCNGYRARC